MSQRSGITPGVVGSSTSSIRRQYDQRRGGRTGGGGYGGGNGGGGGSGGDTYVTTVGYERRPGAVDKVKSSLMGLLLGPVMIAIGCMLLWHNEKWAIKTHKSLHEALDSFVEYGGGNENTHRDYNGKLIHMTQMLSTARATSGGGNAAALAVTDPFFDLSRPNAIRLHREVEIYQWVESIKKKKVKRGEVNEIQEVVNYKKKWVSKPVDSYNFRHSDGHENFDSQLPFTSQSFAAGQVYMGQYMLADKLINQLQQSYPIPANEISKLPQGAQKSAFNNNAIYLPRGGGQQQEQVTGGDNNEGGVQQQQRNIMLTTRAGEDEIGDIRITFSEVPAQVVSVLAKVQQGLLTTWESKQGSGYDIGMLTSGTVSAHDMVHSAVTANTMKTYVFRFGGWLLNLIGFSMITSIIATTADITLNWIPLLGGMATSLINLGVSIANMIMATCTSLTIGSIAWVFYRPVLGISLLVGSLGLFFTASKLGKEKGVQHKHYE